MDQEPGRRRVSFSTGTGAGTAQQELPSDAVAVRNVLRSMGVREYEPRVVQMLLDFMYQYVSDVLLDAEEYAEDAGKAPGEVALADVVIAIQARAQHSFVQGPPQAVLTAAAEAVNAAALPKVEPLKHGLRLPPNKDMLLEPNWQVEVPSADGAGR